MWIAIIFILLYADAYKVMVFSSTKNALCKALSSQSAGTSLKSTENASSLEKHALVPATWSSQLLNITRYNLLKAMVDVYSSESYGILTEFR